MHLYKNHKGFTLAELLTVVAIIAILVAIGIPNFSASTDKAEEAVCLANRRSLKGVIITYYLAGEDMDTAFKENKGSFKCPSGGTFSYTFNEAEGLVEVTCSVHGQNNSLNALFEAYSGISNPPNKINSFAASNPGTTAYKLYNSLDPQQQAFLDQYSWSIINTTTYGLRIFFADRDIVENSTNITYAYKYNPVTGKYQVSETPNSANFGISGGVRYVSGNGSDWGSYENGDFKSGEWMDSLPADLANPKAG